MGEARALQREVATPHEGAGQAADEPEQDSQAETDGDAVPCLDERGQDKTSFASTVSRCVYPVPAAVTGQLAR